MAASISQGSRPRMPALVPRSQGIGDVDDDVPMADFAAEERKKPPPPARWHLHLDGHQPLADAFDVHVLAWDDQFVVAQLPVLVSRTRAEFLAAHPAGLMVQAEVTSGGVSRVVSEVLTAASVYESAPTLIFLEAAVPNPSLVVDLRFAVRTQALAVPSPPGSKAPPPSPPPPTQDRFVRTAVFQRR
jgi:hypothetical protein